MPGSRTVAASSRGAVGLIVVSLVSVVGVTAWYARPAWEDSGWFALALFGVPLLCAVLALWAERGSGTLLAPAAVAALAVVSVAWSLVTGLGIGLAFLLPSVLLLFAAMISWAERWGREPAPPVRT